MKKNNAKSILGKLDVAVAGVVLVALIFLTFVGVIKRYIMRSPITWMEEVQMILFLWVVYLGAGAAFRNGSHVAIEVVVDALPKKISGLVERFDVLLQFIILGYLFMEESSYYMQLVSTGKVTTLLRIPYAVAYAVVPVGGAVMIISMLYASYQKFISKKNKEEVSL